MIFRFIYSDPFFKDKFIIREVLAGLIIKYQAKRWAGITNTPSPNDS